MSEYFFKVTNTRPHMIVFSLGKQLTFEPPEEVPPKLVLEPGPNKVLPATIKAQPAAIRRAWDDLVIGGVLVLEPWTEADESALRQPRTPTTDPNTFQLGLKSRSNFHSA